MRRREALVLGGLVAGAVALPSFLRRQSFDFDFVPIAGLDGFRLIQVGAMSGGFDPLLGVSDRLLPDQAPLYDEPLGNPCQALFGPAGWQEGELPIAVFSDFNCPYCRLLDGLLVDLASSDPEIQLIWHELPLLGQNSVRAAQAAVAARFLGVEQRARSYLWDHNLRPGSAALGRMAKHLGIGDDNLRREVSSQRVATALNKSMTLGVRLGIPGTPATMVGRTLVIGAVKPVDLNKLIALEKSEGRLSCV